MFSATTSSGRPAAGNWRWLLRGSLAALLLLPLLAMQFTDEVNWSLSDFVIMAVMLALLDAAIELAVRSPTHRYLRTALILVAIGAFLLIWLQGAVGLV